MSEGDRRRCWDTSNASFHTSSSIAIPHRVGRCTARRDLAALLPFTATPSTNHNLPITEIAVDIACRKQEAHQFGCSFKRSFESVASGLPNRDSRRRGRQHSQSSCTAVNGEATST